MRAKEEHPHPPYLNVVEHPQQHDLNKNGRLFRTRLDPPIQPQVATLTYGARGCQSVVLFSARAFISQTPDPDFKVLGERHAAYAVSSTRVLWTANKHASTGEARTMRLTRRKHNASDVVHASDAARKGPEKSKTKLQSLVRSASEKPQNKERFSLREPSR